MLVANNVLTVNFPETVIGGYKQRQTQQTQDDSRKRPRTSDRGEGTSAGAGIQSESLPRGQYILTNDGTWVYTENGSILQTPCTTPTSTPQTTPLPMPRTTPLPTPRTLPLPTPATSPLPTPVSSPLRLNSGAVKKRQIEQKEKDPGLILVIRSDIVLPESWNNQQIKKEITKGTLAKYFSSNNAFHPDIIKKNIITGKYDLTRLKRLFMSFEHFHQIKAWGLCRLDSIRKMAK